MATPEAASSIPFAQEALPPLPASFRLIPLLAPVDPDFKLLDRLYTGDGFPANWAAGMLDRGAQAVVIAAGDIPAASAMLIRQPFYIQEIGRSFDPRPDEDYYFGDFVAPPFRGQRLQRHLIRARLAMSRAAGRRLAVAMTRSTIPASLANYVQEGFQIAAEVSSRVLGNWQLDHVAHRMSTLRPTSLSREGVGLPLSFRLRRRKPTKT